MSLKRSANGFSLGGPLLGRLGTSFRMAGLRHSQGGTLSG